MSFKHIVGEFAVKDGKAELVSIADSSNSSILELNNSIKDSIESNSKNLKPEILHELRFPKYKDQLIAANVLIVKDAIAKSVNTDTYIVQSINSVTEMDKICNTLVKRLREWYSYYYPELSNEISDNELFVKKLLQHSKDELMREYDLEISMGPSIEQKDLDMMLSFARQVDDMYLERNKIILYIENTLMAYTPNMYALVGGLIGAKLIEKAGSLKHLAMLPSSTVQLLGAEKALFRHIRNKKIRPPKHGLILSHPFVMNAKRSEKGTAARTLAAKISIAARVDYFKGEFVGDKLYEDLKLKLGE
ncbi:MAG TPA: NOP5/NOP56 family protein [Alphaproteobacteria bacterium]|nr:NOP5/NOP56 family protein [Alphaproteobacteria bacterium]